MAANGNHEFSASEHTWSVPFPYGTVSGISSCNNLVGSWGIGYSGDQGDIKQNTEGTHCWCRMMYPVRSAWVCHDSFESASGCATQCANYCGTGVYGYAHFRAGLFESAGN